MVLAEIWGVVPPGSERWRLARAVNHRLVLIQRIFGFSRQGEYTDEYMSSCIGDVKLFVEYALRVECSAGLIKRVARCTERTLTSGAETRLSGPGPEWSECFLR